VTTYDAAKFRQALIMFIVMCNIAFSVVESPYFQALLNCCSTALAPFFIKAPTYSDMSGGSDSLIVVVVVRTIPSAG
jgi:hypothetical protein